MPDVVDQQASHAITIHNERVVHETVDDEVIIINLENGNYYSLKQVGLQVWKALASQPTEAALVQWLARQYAVTEAELAAAVSALLAQLTAEEIIVYKPASATGANLPEIDTAAGKQPFTPPTLEKYTNMSDLLLLDPIHDVDEQGWPVQKR